MYNNSEICHFGRNISICGFRAKGHDRSTCPLNANRVEYTSTSFELSNWENYLEANNKKYLQNNDIHYFAQQTKPQTILPILDYAGQSFNYTQGFNMDIDNIRAMILNYENPSIANRYETLGRYVQRHRNSVLYPMLDQTLWQTLSKELLKEICHKANKRLFDYIKEDIKGSLEYLSSGFLEQKAQLLLIDVGEEVINHMIDDIIDSRE